MAVAPRLVRRTEAASAQPFRISQPRISFTHQALTSQEWGARGSQPPSDATLSLLLPLLILLSSLLFTLLIFLLFLVIARRKRGGIQLPVDEGPLDLARQDEFEGDGGVDGVEQRWLDTVDEATKTGYIRAKEKGVSAWAFEPDYDAISPPFAVHGRTEITFLADGIGMSRAEGGGACVQCNLPLPKLNEVYYWEAKLYEKPESTQIAIGLATKPYPAFRLPGWSKFSVGYFSEDGFKSHDYPFTASSYGPPLKEGDVIGLGYRPRTGTVFFTRNGKKLDDAYIGLNRHNLFPTVGADGQAVIHVNLGQAGFVFIEANVKKWGLAPSVGTLAPPPAYGSERGSVLLETALGHFRSQPQITPPPPQRQIYPRGPDGRRIYSRPQDVTPSTQVMVNASPRPSRPEQTRLWRRRSSADSNLADFPEGEENSDNDGGSEGSNDRPSRPPSPVDSIRFAPHNPPTPNLLDISLHSITSFSPLQRRLAQELEADANGESSSLEARPREARRTGSTRSVLPPAYHVIDPNTYAPGVAEAMLGESFAAFQAAQQGNWAALGQSLPSNSVYEGRTNATGPTQPTPAQSRLSRFRLWAQRQPAPTDSSV